MALTINDVKKNVAYKNLPIAILDERYLRLFKDNEKTPLLKQLEKKLSDLLKRQGQITNDIKGIKKIKSDLMKSIIENVENENMSELFETIEMPLIFVLFDMQQQGIRVDEQALNTYSKMS